MSGWQFWIDRGGTFTDCVGVDPGTGRASVVKVLSSDRAPLVGIRRLLGLGPEAPIPPSDIRMGTTVATNALLTRGGVPTGLVITRGFRDLLEIGTQVRPDLFDLAIRRPALLYDEVIEIDARCDALGASLAEPDPGAVRKALAALRVRGIRSLAVVLMHAHRAGELERRVGAIAGELGFEHVSLSHEVSGEIGMVGRGDTTVVDAYLTPLLQEYLAGLQRELPGSRLRLMQSSGGLTDASRFRGRDAVLSGPAGGVVACREIARASGLASVVGFDMGGTSTDVCRTEGDLERVHETEVAGVRLRAPMLSIHTIAAGGGSICRYRGFRFTVGPESAGATPGPLCYGAADAEELTVTDVNLFLGRIVAGRFPLALDVGRVEAALAEVAMRCRSDHHDVDEARVAAGFVEIANHAMAEAVRQVTVRRGRDVRDDTLLVFGGAGGQHACAVARRLAMRRVLVHRRGSVLSALGMGMAEITWHGERDAGGERLGDRWSESVASAFGALESEASRALRGEGLEDALISSRRTVDLRYSGTDRALSIPFVADPASALATFTADHQRRFGYARPGRAVEVAAVRLEAAGRTGAEPPVVGLEPPPRPLAGPAPSGRQRLWVRDAWQEVPVFDRESIVPGHQLHGPCLLVDDTSTFVLDEDFRLRALDEDRWLVEDRGVDGAEAAPGAEASTGIDPSRADPAQVEVFNHLFMSIAAQMGSMLEQTAVSTNIRERRDFSCAVFDRDGGLVANAPHIPVHLGAMSESVEAVVEAHPDARPGDVFATNDPAAGGSHLPDITVVMPVFDDAGQRRFFTACRGHHADVGGTRPGSMPPFSRSLAEEGVVLRAFPIVRGGELAREEILHALTAGRHPARRPEDNLADLEAQIAANRIGAGLLRQAWQRFGPDVVDAYMGFVQENAARQVAAEISRIPDGTYRFRDALDDGTPLAVRIEVQGERMRVDFDGTGTTHPGNLNAPRAVTLAALIYVLRTMVSAPIPLNRGCTASVDLQIPTPSLLHPLPEAAVCGGNVETSQRVVDVLLGALGRAAASQGTMNNLTFGDDSFGYYETIGGGAGAGPDFDGASAVQTHMTNTRITDPEVLEARHPIRLREFSIRRGSGGAGRHRGGDGVVREFEMIRPLQVSILAERRDRAPFGLEGGAPGEPGRNVLNGEPLAGKVTLDLDAGDVLRIETPGGGGFGRPEDAD